LGRVLSWQSLPESRCNVLLLGLRRVRIESELAAERAFREATVQVLDDHYTPGGSERRRALHARLIEVFERMLPQIADANDLFNQLSIKNMSLGTLTDVISYAVDLDVRAKQALLAEPNVDRRAAALVAHMTRACNPTTDECHSSDFPPAFSAN
jgi:Lon protease-like protein